MSSMIDRHGPGARDFAGVLDITVSVPDQRTRHDPQTESLTAWLWRREQVAHCSAALATY